MKNDQIEVALRYHDGTKHPGGALLDPHHRYNPADRPFLFKIYEDTERIDLPLNRAAITGVKALHAVTSLSYEPGGESIPDLKIMARLLYFSAGITKHIRRHWGEIAFRAAACTGALYHIELYVVCGDLPGLPAGVYHYDPHGETLDVLRRGDFRRAIVAATGDQLAIARAPAIILYTDIPWRNAVKYQARAYRHAFWDAGTILANTLAMATAHDLPARLVMGFADAPINQLLGLDTEHEFTLALLPVGYQSHSIPADTPEIATLDYEVQAVSTYEQQFPPIHEMHEASVLPDGPTARVWRKDSLEIPLTAPQSDVIPLDTSTEAGDELEAVIIRRGSTREFARIPITFGQLSAILRQATRGIPADFINPTGVSLNHTYLIVNDVEGLSPGQYVYHRERDALELLAEGDFRNTAGHLGLGQALAADASVNVYFLSPLDSVLGAVGNRGYRAAQIEAATHAGRIYLAAYAQGIGATGLTFYDDAVIDFFSPHAVGKSVMFLVLLGMKAARR